MFVPACHLRLRDKGSKAREVAIDLTSLGIPHQEAWSQVALELHHSWYRLYMTTSWMSRPWRQACRSTMISFGIWQISLILKTCRTHSNLPLYPLQPRLEDANFQGHTVAEINAMKDKNQKKIEVRTKTLSKWNHVVRHLPERMWSNLQGMHWWHRECPVHGQRMEESCNP